tara:strand:+ start:997 stop:1287 length:291 start_codon:yes stop_codon:yes gene_type:complete
MPRYKQINNERIQFTAEEEALRDAEEQAWLEEQSKNNETITEQAQYINQRKNAYPEIGDQLDMLWHSIDQDAELKQKYFDFYQAIKSVKVKYPKNG